MEEIFDLQWKFNVHLLRKLGLDYSSVIEDASAKLTWIENYRKALSAELAELVREVRENGIGTHNGRVEIVDMLHFLVSLSHVVHLHPSEAAVPSGASAERDFSACVVDTFLALDDLQNSMKWKWWATGGGFKPEAAEKAVRDLWKCFAEACDIFAMDLESLKTLYAAKNRVNFQRQERGYNEDNKTEEDNLSLERL